MGKWSEVSAQPYFLAGFESGILEASREHCKFICRSGQVSKLEHISLQFGGADVLINPMPGDFKKSAEDAIYRKTDFKVKLVEKAPQISPRITIRASDNSRAQYGPDAWISALRSWELHITCYLPPYGGF